MGNLKKDPNWLRPEKLEEKFIDPQKSCARGPPRPQIFFHPQGLCHFNPIFTKRENAPLANGWQNVGCPESVWLARSPGGLMPGMVGMVRADGNRQPSGKASTGQESGQESDGAIKYGSSRIGARHANLEFAQ